MRTPAVAAIAALLAVSAMIGGVVADIRGLVISGSVVGVIASIAAFVVGLLLSQQFRRGIGIAYAVAALIAGVGFASWFFLDDSAINISGLAAMLVGVVALCTLGLLHGRKVKSLP